MKAAPSPTMLLELRRIERGLASPNPVRIVVDDAGVEWWRELGAADRRSLPALEARGLVETNEDPRYRGLWLVRLTNAGRAAIAEDGTP